MKARSDARGSEDDIPVAEVQRVWAPPRWVFYQKHRPPEGKPWERIIEMTRHGAARYSPDVSPERQREMELICVMNGPLLRVLQQKRMFYMNMGEIIGASDGVETSYLYAEWLTDGQVHGRPIAPEQLRQKGVRL